MAVVVEIACDQCGGPVWRYCYESLAHAVHYAEGDASYASLAEPAAAGGLDGRSVICKTCRGEA